ncbi:hypothetical protein BDN70DRAFT_886090 [Pholiota conissans]|uniref:Uncharacterized protein n=1 Tax=Pholiota conissans TaxID=109636 RepID=A0A9P5YR79_9AGAR|nr:hypothetical protein BDN70DRAFT_886090 [Pholiota conissans]
MHVKLEDNVSRIADDPNYYTERVDALVCLSLSLLFLFKHAFILTLSISTSLIVQLKRHK